MNQLNYYFNRLRKKNKLKVLYQQKNLRRYSFKEWVVLLFDFLLILHNSVFSNFGIIKNYMGI